MIDVKIRGRCRHKQESDTYMLLSNVKGALYSFVLRPRFILSHWVLLLGKVLMRQHYMHHLCLWLGTKGSVEGKTQLVCLRQSNKRNVIRGLIIIYCNYDYVYLSPYIKRFSNEMNRPILILLLQVLIF